MLKVDDIVRIMEAADDLGIDIDDRGARTLWNQYETEKGQVMCLPLDYSELLGIVEKYHAEVAV